ncbi:MAG TPA: class I SAM-dependent methyltransferase [Ktedonobacteraceae bacterium]|jgi:2-polyprenyl-3-methyl-5-hydroxy-6-metoxy-1,4-benzoquinol methylase
MSAITNADAIKAWSQVPPERIATFGEEGDATRRYLLNPAIFRLLGDVREKLILDAGCGQGYLSRLLARRGARVTGIEPAHPWYLYAVQQEQSEPVGITYLQADLAQVQLTPGLFDAVIASMVFMDIPDYLPALRNCVAALKPAGTFVIALLHPCFEETGARWQHKGYVEVREYFREHEVEQTYGHFIHRPLGTYLNDIIEAGCVLRQISEPQLDEALACEQHSERYAQVPGYLLIAATKLA